MPSDPLPLSPETEAGRRLFTDMDPMDMMESNGVTPDDIIAIEQEARTLARAEVIAEAVAAVTAVASPFDRAFSANFVARDDVLAALSRLGERE